MASFSWEPAPAFSPPGRLAIPREVGAWAEIEGATLIAPPTARWNTLGAVAARATSARGRDGAVIRRVSAVGTPTFVVGPICGALGAAVIVWGPPAGMPLVVAIPIAVVLLGIAALILTLAAAEVRAGPLLEVEGRAVRVPRLGLDLGAGSRLEPLVLRLEHALRYDDGVLMQRFCLPAIWHEGGSRRSVVVLPAPMREKAAGRLVRRLLDRPPAEKVRVVEISSEGLRKGPMPSGD